MCNPPCSSSLDHFKLVYQSMGCLVTFLGAASTFGVPYCIAVLKFGANKRFIGPAFDRTVASACWELFVNIYITLHVSPCFDRQPIFQFFCKQSSKKILRVKVILLVVYNTIYLFHFHLRLFSAVQNYQQIQFWFCEQIPIWHCCICSSPYVLKIDYHYGGFPTCHGCLWRHCALHWILLWPGKINFSHDKIWCLCSDMLHIKLVLYT